MPEMLAVGLEAAAAVLALAAALAMTGYGLTRVLAPPSLRPLSVPLIPAVGAAGLIVGSYFLNLVVNLTAATGVLLGLAAALNGWLIWRRGWWLPRPTRSQWVVIAMAAALIVVAFLPHLHGRSLAMLGLNVDEDLYVPLAELLRGETAFMDGAAEGPYRHEFQSVVNHSRGWGFAHLLAITSILSNAPAFHAYVPALYLLLGLSVPAVFVFGRAGLGVSERTAAVGASLYALHGLPLWFTGMGFGPHTVSFLLFPAAIATGVTAIKHGGGRALLLAALTSAALLVSYFWAISAVYLVVAGVLGVTLVIWGRGRLCRLRNLTALGIGIAALAAPGLFWLIRWAGPQLGGIASNLNGRFGNAWGDTETARIELAFGMAPYRLAADQGPLGEALGPNGVEALLAAKDALFWPALALALLGLVTLRGQRPVAFAMAAGYAAFMYWVAAGAEYQYGHLKNTSFVAYFVAMLIASGVSNLYHAEFALWSEDLSRRLRDGLRRLGPALRALGVVLAAAIGLALVHNTYQTVWWYWAGVGWNVPRAIAHDARAAAEAFPTGSRVFFADRLTYPLPGERIKISEHVLGFHFPEHQRSSWAGRARSVWIASLTDVDVYGFAASRAFGYEAHRPDDRYDFIVLNRSDDPRAWGLVETDAVLHTDYWTAYEIPEADRLTGNEIAAANRGEMNVTGRPSLQFGVRDGELAIGADVQAMPDRLLIGAVSPGRTELLLRTGASARSVELAPGLTWITSPAGPSSRVEVQAPGSPVPVHIVAARRLRGSDTPHWEVEHVDRQTFSVDLRAEGSTIVGSLIAVNPTGAGLNVGLSYQEAPTGGFWRSGASVSAPAQLIELTYTPATRELRERVNGGAEAVTRARDADPGGNVRLQARMERSYVEVFRALLLDYQLSADGPRTVRAYHAARVFDI